MGSLRAVFLLTYTAYIYLYIITISGNEKCRGEEEEGKTQPLCHLFLVILIHFDHYSVEVSFHASSAQDVVFMKIKRHQIV